LLYLHPEGEFRPSVRWNEMTSYDKQLIEAKQVVNVPDLKEWLDLPEWRKHVKDPDMQQALASGFLAFVTYPVIVANRVVATVGFSRKKDKGPFSNGTMRSVLAACPLVPL
jgi:hypothetical protein